MLQAADEPLVEKPKLTEKLLGKPPFRFLHDVISAVQKSTGYAPDLYTAQELDSSTIQDKDGKIMYLTKIIDVVSAQLGEPVPARPAKIVAGLEPENTNVFLQMLGRAARLGPATDAVQRVLGNLGQAPAEPAAATPPPPPAVAAPLAAAAPAASAARPPSRQQPPVQQPLPVEAPQSVPQSLQPEGETAARTGRPSSRPAGDGSSAGLSSRRASEDTAPKQPSASGSRRQTASREAALPVPAAAAAIAAEPRERTPDSAFPAAPSGRPATREGGTPPARDAPTSRVATPATGSSRDDVRRVARQPSGRSRATEGEAAAPPGLQETQPPPPSNPPAKPSTPTAAPGPDDTIAARPTNSRGAQRPQSARKAPPKIASHEVSKQQAGLLSPAAVAAARPPSGRPAERPASGIPLKTVTLFEEGRKGDDDDDDVEVVTEQQLPLGGAGMGGAGRGDGNQGVLVKNILDAQKDLQRAGAEAAGGGDQDGDGTGGTGIILKRQGKAAAAGGGVKAGDLSAVRDMLQKVCQASMPLARSMECLPEDIENMSKEYRFWVTERKVYQERLAEERARVRDLSAIEAQLTEADGKRRQLRERIVEQKATMLRNDETIQKLLNMVVAGIR